MREQKQTRRQFLKEFVGPPKRPATPEERAAASAAYEQAMVEWRAACGDMAKRKNNFHRIADAEQGRSTADVGASLPIPLEWTARRQAALQKAVVLCMGLPPPTRTTAQFVTCSTTGHAALPPGPLRALGPAESSPSCPSSAPPR